MIFEDLLTTGEIQRVGDGRLMLQGRALSVFRWIDAQLEAMAIREGAEPVRVPAVIDRAILDRAGFFESFGDVATRVTDGDRLDAYTLSPALCYHAYAGFADRRLDSPIRMTTVGLCHRRERKPQVSLTRLWEFTMREVIFIGAAEWVASQRERWVTLVSTFATSIGLVGDMKVATDPFFVAESRGKQLMQQLKELKYELQVSIDANEPDVAVASMNLHETFFGSRFGLTLADGSTASSGCVAFGLERWTLAMIAQLGIERAAEVAGLKSRATGNGPETTRPVTTRPVTTRPVTTRSAGL